MMRVSVGLVLPIVALWLTFLAFGLGRATHSRLLTLALACCVGIGASSAVTFVTLMLGGRLDAGFVVRDVLIWTALGGVSLWRLRGRWTREVHAAPFPAATIDDWIVRAAFLIVLALAISVPVTEYLSAPHGQWDAWAIWNQKARFMYRAGPRWTDSMAIAWSQPSHPPLVAASVARLWAYNGGESTLVPAMLSGAFALSTVMVVMAALDLRRPRAWVAGMVLVTPFTFTHLASAQTADLPLSLFFIATVVMLPMRPDDWRAGRETAAALWLAGGTASLAAWTKNEGVVFLAATTALVAWSAFRHGRLVDVCWWVLGAAPFLAALTWFKLGVVPESPEYLEGATSLSTAMTRVLSEGRLGVIVGDVATMALHWGGPAAAGILPVVVALAIWAGLVRSRLARGILSIAAIMTCGYVAVYFLTPLDVRWLILTTFDRLTLQLWPLLIFAACAPTTDLEDGQG